MTDSASHDQGSQPLKLRNFYLGRQPVLDRNQALYGYELLFRGSAQGPGILSCGCRWSCQRRYRCW